MKFHKQSIEGVFLIEPTPFVDDRGIFRRHFCSKEFAAAGIAGNVEQANVSENVHAYTLRGFHYQLRPHGEGKTLSCLYGSVYDIVVDLRQESATYKKWLSFEMNDKNRHSVHVPPGCANAFLTLVDGVVVQYYCSYPYFGPAERGVRYNDPVFEFTWPQEPRFISERIRTHPDYRDPEK